MAHMPAELAVALEDTTVVGDVDAFIEYLENGQALHDWHERRATQSEECDAFLYEHRHLWSHIVIQARTPDAESLRAA